MSNIVNIVNVKYIADMLFSLWNKKPARKIETVDQSLDNREAIYNKL